MDARRQLTIAASWITLVAAVACLSACGGASLPPVGPQANQPSPLTSDVMRISDDPFSNASSQHATEVEPFAFAFGSTIVATFQTGRFSTVGASDTGFATSHDGGMTWISGVLPGTTNLVVPPGPFDSVSDPAVAYDAAHGVWLISSLPILFNGAPTPAVLVSRSSNALTWSNPVAVAPGQSSTDKGWIVCDNTPSSLYYGHCYVEWDEPGTNGMLGTIHMSTSTDGGLTWGPVRNTLNNATGIGGQPLVQPNGTVIVPFDGFNEQNVLAFVSHDGGASWTAALTVTQIADHLEAGNLRSGPLPSAAIDAAGTVYLVWQDCRFRTQCTANDIVLTTSTDGVSWSALTRVPIDSLTSGVDHFLPGIGVAPMTAGPGAHLGITYYYYSNSACQVTTCRLSVGFISSQNGGATWSVPVALAGPMSVTWLPQTRFGAMVGDYTATTFSGNQPIGIFAVAHAPSGRFDEAMYAPKPGTIVLGIGPQRSSYGERPIPGARSDHPPRRPPPIR